MSDKLVQLADILPPVLPTQSSAPYWLIVLVAALVLCLCFWLVKRNRLTPTQSTLKQLKRGELTPREAAHALAQLTPSSELDRLRFQRQEPTAQTILQLFESEQSHG